MNRRDFVSAVAAACVAGHALAQTRPRVIGFLTARDAGSDYDVQYLNAFKAGMRELGYVEGKDYVIELRSGKGDARRLADAAAELTAKKVDLIVATGTPPAMAARRATGEIPILITNAANPVENGLAASLSRPGKNVTGLTGVGIELYPKRLELLLQVLPTLRRVAFVYNPNNPSDVASAKAIETACARLKLTAILAPIAENEDVDSALARLAGQKPDGFLVTGGNANVIMARGRVTEYAARHKLPAIYNNSYWVESGGLVSYGVNGADSYRRVASYADKIFKGAKPGDLPIQRPTSFELIINNKAARALGLTIPPELLLRANKVIE